MLEFIFCRRDYNFNALTLFCFKGSAADAGETSPASTYNDAAPNEPDAGADPPSKVCKIGLTLYCVALRVNCLFYDCLNASIP